MKMKFLISILAMSLSLMSFSFVLCAADVATKVQDSCPIMGEAINKKVFTDYKGKRIYFCCEDCVKTFKANPEKYIKEMEAKGIKLEEKK